MEDQSKQETQNIQQPKQEVRQSSPANQVQKKSHKPVDEKSRVYLKVGILAVINLLLFFALLVYVGKLPILADQIQNERLENPIFSEEDFAKIQQQVSSARPKVEEIKTFLPDESGIVDFVSEIDTLRSSGVVKEFHFVSSGVINDKTKTSGLPILIELQGTPEQIDAVLRQIQSFPYLLRAVNITIKPSEEEGMLEFSYGGVLYVDKEVTGD